MFRKDQLIGAAAAAALLALPGIALADGHLKADGVIPETEINVIGNVSVTTQFRDIQKPFWTETIPALTGGKVKVNFKGWNEMGLKGPEGFRLAQRGQTQFATFQLGHVQRAAVHGPDPRADHARGPGHPGVRSLLALRRGARLGACLARDQNLAVFSIARTRSSTCGSVAFSRTGE